MDRYQRPGGARGGRAEPMGTVRRARDMMPSKTLDLPQTQIPQPQYKGKDNTRTYQQNPQLPRIRQHMPAALSASRGGGQPMGAAISRPTHVPQWPLAASAEGTSDQRQQTNQNGPPPQRPPRPRNVPSMLDASKLQDHTPSFQYKAAEPSQRQEDDTFSPDSKSPSSHASRPSTISSVGSIPDFPLPMPLPPQVTAGPQRRGSNQGPPSARRGASSYYSTASYVSPIPEEGPRAYRSHGSYASSAAIPSQWDDDNLTEIYYEDEDEQHSPGSPPGDHTEDSNLVRSASFGRPGKPTVVTMGRASEKFEPATNLQAQTSAKLAKMGVFGPGAAVTVAASATAKRPTSKIIQSGKRNTVWPTVGDVDSPLASGTGFIDSSSSESVPKVAQPVTTSSTSETISPKAVEARISQILAATQAASRTSTTPPALDRTLTRLSAIRRPPRLDIDAVREAESRGSLTSLPDLIRRATKLAAMMEKGKRPASRLALTDFSSENLVTEKEKGLRGDRKSGLSGMLAAFPPPGLAGTPTRSPSGHRNSTWPSPLGGAESQQALRPKDKRRKQRRCCGLPVWVFVLILIFTMIIIAAAVVVPLELLVFHKAGTAKSVSVLSACQASTTCDNGGTVVVTAGVCACICSNGFTGSSCTSGANASCSMVSVNSANPNDSTSSLTYSNATVGNAIPRIVSAAQTNFSIPLVYETIIAKLNAGDLSCDAENALVTFDGSSNRVAAAAAVKPSSDKRDARRNNFADKRVAPTSVLTASSIPTTSRSGPTSTSGVSTSFTVSQEVLDFARTAVLYILQVQELADAVTAQGNIQSFLSSVGSGAESWANSAGNVTATDSVVVDFSNVSVTVNGTRVGGTTSTSAIDKRSTAKRQDEFFPVPTGAIVHTGWEVTLEANKEDE